MNKKGQGALEYLLLIGGAILVAVVVITILSGIGSQGGETTERSAIEGICKSRAGDACGVPDATIAVGGTSCTCSDSDTDPSTPCAVSACS